MPPAKKKPHTFKPIESVCLLTKSHFPQVLMTESLSFCFVPMGSPSRGGDVVVYVFDINQPSLPTLFYSVLVSVSAFMALSTVFHSISSPYNSPLSHSVLPVLYLPYWSFKLYISMKISLSPNIILHG